MNHHSKSLFFENKLNLAQNQAVSCIDGPLLVLAGAGSGKTRVLTYRMAEIILRKKASPTEILCVTFTNKAAEEMKLRIESILSGLELNLRQNLWVSTFHSFCFRILRQTIHLIGYDSNFLIYDQADQLNLIKTCMKELRINTQTLDPKKVQSSLQKVKNLGLSPSSGQLSYFMSHREKIVYNLYEQKLKESQALDFNDLLLKTYEVFNKSPQTLEHYQNHFLYIMVDEYQDTNAIQYNLLKQLAQKNKNICAVGDEDQSIYSWRGADYSNITNFKRDFRGTKTIKLEENYRSSKNIVSAANGLISKNKKRSAKTLFTHNPEGEKILLFNLKNEYDEARFIAETISQEIQFRSLDEVAIFYRTNAQSRTLEEELRRHDLKYKIVGGMKFYQRKEIKDLLAYLRLIVNSKDNMAFQRIINTPIRGLGKTTINKLEDFSLENSKSFYEAIPICLETDLFNSSIKKKLLDFYKLIADLRKFSLSHSPKNVYTKVLNQTEYIEILKKKNPLEAENKSENLEAFYNALEAFEKKHKRKAKIELFLEELSLSSDSEDEEQHSSDCVHLMTLHASKGLEFPVVFIIGCNENLLPSSQSTQSSQLLEEERRLFYVGMTRAKEKLYLSYSHTRKNWGVEVHYLSSRFLSDLPDDYIECFNKTSYNMFSKKHKKPNSQKLWKAPLPYNKSNNYKIDKTIQDSRHKDDWIQTRPEEEPYYLWKKGMKVLHPQFGKGTIFKIEGKGNSEKLSISFEDHRTKKFISKYVKLQRL